MLLLSVFSLTASATTFTETFGDITSSGCGSQWYGGDCEVGWTAVGQTDSLAMCTVPTSNYGVALKPPSTFTGFGRNISLPSGNNMVSWTAKVQSDANGSKVRLQYVFRNSGGTILSTVSYTETVDAGVYSVSGAEAIPSGAASVDLAVIGVGSGTVLWVDSTVATYWEEATDAECDTRAEQWRINAYNECYNDDGIPTGTCQGDPSPAYEGGCHITCIIICYKSEEEEKDVTCPDGF
jgi:hypothetical protein